jgi:DNA mismatch endonuclease (patch repair protein)
MADIYSREKRSEVMSKIRSKNTKPELVVRKFLFSKGFRFRIHQKNLPGSPDIVLKKYKTVVFVHGCFWHGHPSSKCKIFKMPKSNIVFWETKIKKNQTRHKKAEYALKKLNWKSITIWECELSSGRQSRTLTRLVSRIIATNSTKDRSLSNLST